MIAWNGWIGVNACFTSYLGVSGSPSQAMGGAWPNNVNGVLWYYSRVRLTDITDGTSNTLMVGERPPSNGYEYGVWFAGPGYDGMGTGDVVLGSTETDLVNFLTSPGNAPGYSVSCPQPANNYTFYQNGDINDPCHQVHFWSLHTGGANFCMADGSVQFISYSVTPTTMAALMTRNGGEVLGSDWK
jgi:prepilin-type processing-associated H-X9-DG protein